MPFKDRRTPGVYVTELSAFPPSVVGVQTAVPAFIGYTEKAEISGKPVFLKPIRIGSLADYEQIFGGGYEPTYEIHDALQAEIDDNTYDFKVLNPVHSPPQEEFFVLKQSGESKFNLYNSMRLFYANGGGNCYVVSVGNYEQAADAALVAVDVARTAARPANADPWAIPSLDANVAGGGSILPITPIQATPVTKQALMNGLAVIKDQSGPTMLVIPEAVLLGDISQFGAVAQAMLAQCEELQDRVALLDVYGSRAVNKADLNALITAFRGALGNKSLNYGMSYFPFLDTTVVPASDFTYANLSPIGVTSPLSPLVAAPLGTTNLETILTWENDNLYGDAANAARHRGVQRYIDHMTDPEAINETLKSLNQNLTAALPLLGDMLRIIVDKNDVLPPSPAMAGVYTYVDATRGVWNAPANITVSSVVKPTYKLDNEQQGDLNMPIDGKAVNAIREFVGRGTIVWGARTLDGNSNDFRYIQVRRTLVYIEQSIKNALNGFVFAPNDGNTWVTVTAMVSNFLQDLWSRGGLMGATASEAFDVTCGLGSTMTPTDVLQGYMIVQVRVQMIRPAEFIELTFKQKMEGIS